MDCKTNKNRIKISTPASNFSPNFKILSWNIQSSKNNIFNKFHNTSFTKILSVHNILCLQEIRQAVKLPGYRSHCNLRPDEKYGGVGILYRNDLLGGIELVKTKKINDLIVCKLKKSFFKLTRDIFIVNAYVTPNNSSSTNTYDGRELLHQIADLINDLKNRGDIILCGDFNSRISDAPGLSKHEDEKISEHIPLPDDYIPDKFTARCTQDMLNNSYCNDFLSLVMNNKLTILNGRTLGDLTGAITCIRPNGCSVVDYFVTSPLLLDKNIINFMKILPFTEFSDHKPLSLSLSTSKLNLITGSLTTLADKYQPAPSRFIIDENSQYSFVKIQQDEKYKKQLNSIFAIINDGIQNRDSVVELNDKYVKYLHSMASECFKSTNHKNKNTSTKMQKNNPWFNWQCRLGKRELRRAANATNKFPNSEFLRQNYYKVKKSYKSLTNKHKNSYFNKLNSDIENGKVISWKQFKKLKMHKQSNSIEFDCQDMVNFESFFSALYSDNHKTIDQKSKQSYINEADNINSASPSPGTLNNPITLDEMKETISTLKRGKASSMDMISNEILKSLDKCNLDFLNKLFNTCLDSGHYPWNVNVVTPLHKKGCKDDPDNYRAVAVSSALGKLFSTILLNRLITFRNINCPDPPNQLGFTKNAQTYDHILTMQTIASKYKKLKKNVHAIFVDFRKAFDSVCRQALFYKLAQNGITGKFYEVLRDMYSNSYAHVKLSGHLSNAFQTRKGTEQGHPLSPDLFKLFLSDLSPLLTDKHSNCPYLSNTLISHLLWADDLILLSLDEKNAQFQLDQLALYCDKWGIEINKLKTKRVIFGRKNKSVNYQELFINGEILETAESYCYLGIILHESGNFKPAVNDLKIKATRAFFGLKRTVNRTKLSFRSLTTLFDSLIKPISLYGAPLWTPTLSIIKNLSAAILPSNRKHEGIIPKINRTQFEKVHQSFLKWALGLHRKASNIGTLGESGRYPLIYQSIKLTLNYYQRLSESKLNQNSFVVAALKEQKSLNLPWYKNIESLMKIDEIFNQDHVTAYLAKNNKNANSSEYSDTARPKTSSRNLSFINKYNLGKLTLLKPLPSKQFRPAYVLKTLKEHYRNCWEHEKVKSPKLAFYHGIKQSFEKEPYLDMISNASIRYSTTRLRISAHRLEIESGRYKNIPRDERTCKWCQLSLSGNFIEDEIHVLYNCDLYNNLRIKLLTTLNNSPASNNSPTHPVSVSSQSHDPDQHINPQILQNALMKLLSPNVTLTIDRNDPLLHHHLSPSSTKLEKRRSYIINAIGSFIASCFNKRCKFLEELRLLDSNGKTAT